MNDPDIHELPKLLEIDNWSLFEQKLGNDLLDSAHKVELATKMLTKCGGVPLAIKTLAGLLHSKNHIHQWKEIEVSSVWKEDAITLPTSIKLSFKYSPSIALKKCFTYYAIFHEDEIIKKNRLIQLWMAQGFLQHPDDEMEKVGEDYFHVLLNNSLFQDAKFDKLGHMISCKMHDAVHALAHTLSRNDVTQEMRHLSLSKSRDVNLMFKFGRNLRTFSVSFILIKPQNFTMKTVNNLYVLSLVSVDLEELPDLIENKTMAVAEALQPHSNFASLKISNYQAMALPQWVTKMLECDGSSFSNLVCLEIDQSTVEHLTISLRN
ncbi:hypothetical protein Cgig2_009968 [Carnegiea gigantea]|uniref:NB-ARC domain-containing protein n=1 Tax=Carnegiea gigantea TaxID=171969 RepID=A0A9Q1JLL4_9CARY|nr:hypothetical protein Cgig2_009968 [Carnegiea gigantea]